MARSGGFSRDTDLTGVWSGEYWYDGGFGSRTLFAAHIIDANGSLDGTTLETATFGGGARELSACISGARDGASLAFTKIYDAGLGVHREPISYSGAANADFTLIEGRWTFGPRSDWTGGFQMRRGSPGASIAKKRKAKVPTTVDR